MKELDLLIVLTNILPDPVVLLDDHGQILTTNTPSAFLPGMN
ncbi:hypothetical protein [Mucilaginibacter segetis]|nr:hypothetical protein [Mucilaginibacter segetis]